MFVAPPPREREDLPKFKTDSSPTAAHNNVRYPSVPYMQYGVRTTTHTHSLSPPSPSHQHSLLSFAPVLLHPVHQRPHSLAREDFSGIYSGLSRRRPQARCIRPFHTCNTRAHHHTHTHTPSSPLPLATSTVLCTATSSAPEVTFTA